MESRDKGRSTAAPSPIGGHRATVGSLAVATAALALAAVSCGGGSSPAGPTGTSVPVRFTVMTFNIQHGIDGTNHYNLQRAIDTIARLQPDVVGLQEVARQNAAYNCDDEATRIADGVSAATGLRWDVVFQQEWLTTDFTCQTSGRGTGYATEGLAFITKRPTSASAMLQLVDSRIGLEVALRDVANLPVIVTHLASGSDLAPMRSQEVGQLVGWTAGFGEPRILMGDFNARPQDGELQPLMAGYRDAWAEAAKLGHAVGNGFSHGTSRIDYIFYLPGTRLTLESAQIVDTTSLVGAVASDHSPVMATFTMR